MKIIMCIQLLSECREIGNIRDILYPIHILDVICVSDWVEYSGFKKFGNGHSMDYTTQITS